MRRLISVQRGSKEAMNIITWKYTVNEPKRWENDPVEAWRRALYVSGFRNGIEAGIGWEVLYDSNPCKWRKSPIDYYVISLTKYFAFGRDHVYYDGCHCSLSLGFLHFSWNPSACRKCFIDGYDEEEADRMMKCHKEAKKEK